MARIAKARIKKVDDFPEVEHCCLAAQAMQEPYGGMEVEIDLDDTILYGAQHRGHCGQTLPYKLGVMVVGGARSFGYVPFELLDIDEGNGDAKH